MKTLVEQPGSPPTTAMPETLIDDRIDMSEPEMAITDRLLCSQIIFRHGARTPLYVLPSHKARVHGQDCSANVCVHSKYGYNGIYYGPDLFYPFPQSELVRTKIVKADGKATRSQRDYFLSIGIDPEVRLQGGAEFGVLTTLGRRQLYDLGVKMAGLHSIYKGFVLSDSLLRVHSSFIPRTLDSARSFLSGLLGKRILTNLNNGQCPILDGVVSDSCPTDVPVHVQSFDRDFIFPNYLANPILNRDVVALYNEMEADNPLKELRSRFLKEFEISDYQNGILELDDELAARKALDLPMSSELHKWHDLLSSNTAREYNYIYGYNLSNRDFMRASVGRLLHLLCTNLKAHAPSEGTHPHFYVYSSHDSTLHCLNMAFGQTDLGWPPFASYILIQLFDGSEGPYVKITFNDQQIAINGKTAPTLDDFLKGVGEYLMTDEDLPLFNKTTMLLR